MTQVPTVPEPTVPEPTVPEPTVGDWGFGLLFDAIKDAVVVTDANTGRIVL